MLRKNTQRPPQRKHSIPLPSRVKESISAFQRKVERNNGVSRERSCIGDEQNIVKEAKLQVIDEISHLVSTQKI